MPHESGLDQIYQQQADRFDLFINDNRKLIDSMPIKEIATAIATNLDDETEAKNILTEYLINLWNESQADRLLELEELSDDVVKDITDYVE